MTIRAISNDGFRSDSLYEKKIGEDLVFNNALPKSLTITQVGCLKAKPKLHNGMVYRQFIMIPVVLIDATNYVYKCITTYTSIQIWVSFNIALLCKNFGFLSRLFCPTFLPVTWSHRDQYLLYVFMYSCVYNGAPQPCFFTLYGRLHTDDRPDDDHICFPFYIESCTRWLNLLPIFKQEGPLVISMKINTNIKTGTS